MSLNNKLSGRGSRSFLWGHNRLLQILAISSLLPAGVVEGLAADPPCLTVEGKPFFVIGMYDYPGGDERTFAHLQEMADAGINTVHWGIHALPNPPSAQARDFSREDLDNARKLGVKVIAALNSTPPWRKEDLILNWGSNPEQFKPDSELHRRILQIKDHPALLMYETMDEPAGCHEMDNRPTWPALETLKACYTFVKATDPTHPVWCNEVAWFWCHDRLSLERFRAWSTICDVYSQDDYPVGGPAYPDSPLFTVAQDVDQMLRIVGDDSKEAPIPRKPVLMVLQGQGRNFGKEGFGRNPNRIETRYVAYASIIHGAKGILWWGTYDLAPLRDQKGGLTLNGEFWEIIKVVCREVHTLKDAFTTQRILTGFTLGDKRLDAALFRHNGVNYLLVSNKSEQTLMSASVSASGCGWKPAADGKVRVMFERRKLPLGEGTSFRDTFAPWDVHIYTDARAAE